MIIRKYKVFVKAAEFGNFTKAGAVMGYTQSGVSHMMKGLEDEFGFALFRRNSKGITLTDNGERLLPIIRRLLESSEQLDQTVSSVNGLLTGKVCIASFSSASTHWLPRIIKEFQADFPMVQLSIMEGGIKDIDGWLQEGVADLAFYSRQPHQTFDWIPLKQDPLLAVLPKDYPLKEGSPLDTRKLNGKPFILSSPGFDYDIHRVLEENQITPDIRFYSKDDYAIASMVENNLGVSILPELVLKWCSAYIRTAELKPKAFRELGIAVPTLQEASPAVKKILEYSLAILKRDKLI